MQNVYKLYLYSVSRQFLERHSKKVGRRMSTQHLGAGKRVPEVSEITYKHGALWATTPALPAAVVIGIPALAALLSASRRSASGSTPNDMFITEPFQPRALEPISANQ